MDGLAEYEYLALLAIFCVPCYGAFMLDNLIKIAILIFVGMKVASYIEHYKARL